MWNLPNILTVARICLAPVIALLPFINGSGPKIIAFVVFLAAAVSDVVDGWYARSRNVVTDFGKLLDPLADKLILVATLVPIFWITRPPSRELFPFAFLGFAICGSLGARDVPRLRPTVPPPSIVPSPDPKLVCGPL